jgi:hypothetical protein
MTRRSTRLSQRTSGSSTLSSQPLLSKAPQIEPSKPLSAPSDFPSNSGIFPISATIPNLRKSKKEVEKEDDVIEFEVQETLLDTRQQGMQQSVLRGFLHLAWICLMIGCAGAIARNYRMNEGRSYIGKNLYHALTADLSTLLDILTSQLFSLTRCD